MPRSFKPLRALAPAVSLMMAALPAGLSAAPRDAAAQPNFLIIVADDLGYSDIGAFGGEIDTPNLDAIAAKALKFTGFHTAPTCSPTRSMLLTGLDHHEAGIGNMAEVIAPNQKGKPGYEGYLRADTASLAELLGQAGYRTHYAGKWHLGLKPEQDPHARGFQTSFAMLQGGHNHFGTDVAQGSGTRGSTYTENGARITRLPEHFYSSDAFAGSLIDQLKAGKAGPDGGKPFFAYLAFTAPHWPLQAPDETIAKYKGRFDGGYEALRERRLQRQIALGLLDPATVPHDFDLAPRWAGLTPEQRAREARRMEVYAAMVDRLDQNVGRVVAALKASGDYDNTVILFLADNGAEGALLDSPSMSMVNAVYAAADNRLENIGKATSYESIGPGWAEAAAAPSWRVKGFTTEGGTRTVSFLAGPGIAPGVSGVFRSAMDVVPTFLELAHVPLPQGTFAGREVKPVRGQSWADALRIGPNAPVYAGGTPVGEELFGGRALRDGDWKLVDIGDGAWRLFHIAADPGETRDLAAAEPARVAALAKAWDQYASSVGVVMPEPRQPILDRPGGR